MADRARGTISFDQLVQEGRRKRQTEQLAQEILGSNRRSRTPLSARANPSPGASLASRVGVAKRTVLLPRSDSAPARVTRQPPRTNRNAERPLRAFAGQPTTTLDYEEKSNGYIDLDAPANNVAAELSIRGAAGGPDEVVYQNFAPGTTAADIEHVMMEVGGQITECRLVAANPTVIAEMIFVERAGAEAVIATFNNKKADGRTLHVYLKGTAPPKLPQTQSLPAAQPEPETPAAAAPEETMDIDENAQSREAENRLREERRGPRADRNGRGGREVFPAGPRGDRGYDDDYYNRGPRRADPAYQDGRYGFGGGDRYNGPRGGRYRDEGRMYSDGMRRGGGQNWRP